MNQLKVWLCVVFLCRLMIGGCETRAQSVGVSPDKTPSVEAGGIKVPPPAQADEKLMPLSKKEKIKFGAKDAYFNPGAYVGPAFSAFFTTRRDKKAFGKTSGDRFADGMSFYARSFGTNSTAEFLGGGVYPVLFKQDPRYFPSPNRKFGARLAYAASRIVLTRGDDGRTQINFSRIAGNLTAASLANIYERDTVKSRDSQGRPLTYRWRVGARTTIINFAQTTAFDAVGYIVFEEFNLFGKLGNRTRKLLGR